MSADEGFCLPAWGTYTHTTNRLHGDALIIAYTIRDPMQPVCMTHFATLSENIIATSAYGSPTGAASPVMPVGSYVRSPLSISHEDTRTMPPI